MIIGHSERRQYFNETDDTVNRKLKTALEAGLMPIVCVGEVLEEREAGLTEDVLRRQCLRAFNGISARKAAKLVVAYEPVWAIGTGKTATPQMAADAHLVIRGEAAKAFGEEFADHLRILYGGSVKPDNVKALMAEEEIDGALVGGASLDPNRLPNREVLASRAIGKVLNDPFAILYISLEAIMRKWWNWQTHHLEGVAPKGMGVQIPPSAPTDFRRV